MTCTSSTCSALGFASLPEGALLCITASLDLQSGKALTSASTAAHESTAAALLALGEGISRAQEEHRAVAASIQQERASGREQQTAEGAMLLEVMGMLAPLRSSRLAQQNHGTALGQLFETLEQGAATQLSPEAESALEASEAEAHVVRQTREAVLRAGVADGFLQQFNWTSTTLAAELLQLHGASAAPEIEPSDAVAPVIASATMAVAAPHASTLPTSSMIEPAVLSDHEDVPAVVSSGASSSWQIAHSSLQIVPEETFARVPEGPLLRVAALMDLVSGKAFNAAATTVRDDTEVAFRSLGASIAQARQAQHDTTAAIEQERLAAREHQAGEGAAWAAALNLLAPHRVSFERAGMTEQVEQLFGMLEHGPEQRPEQAAAAEAAEAEFDARIAAAEALAQTREAAVRSRVADGELHAQVVL